MKRRLCVAIVAFLAVFGFGLAAVQAELVYDLSADYSLASNPNGAWTYGSNPVGMPLTSFTPYTHTGTIWDIVGWTFGEGTDPYWNDPNVSYNPLDTEFTAYGYHWAPRGVGLGSTGGDSAVVRWTCQEAGEYDINATFTGVLEGSTQSVWLISKNTSDQWLMPVEVHSYGESQTYAGRETFAVGDTLDFVNYLGDQYTGLSATISQVPEPDTLALISSSLLGAVFFAWRKRK
jgi:hypothetical protein